jgi:hypothetical protein
MFYCTLSVCHSIGILHSHNIALAVFLDMKSGNRIGIGREKKRADSDSTIGLLRHQKHHKGTNDGSSH